VKKLKPIGFEQNYTSWIVSGIGTSKQKIGLQYRYGCLSHTPKYRLLEVEVSTAAIDHS